MDFQAIDEIVAGDLFGIESFFQVGIPSRNDDLLVGNFLGPNGNALRILHALTKLLFVVITRSIRKTDSSRKIQGKCPAAHVQFPRKIISDSHGLEAGSSVQRSHSSIPIHIKAGSR